MKTTVILCAVLTVIYMFGASVLNKDLKAARIEIKANQKTIDSLELCNQFLKDSLMDIMMVESYNRIK